jgi:hypothetical protein
MLTQDSAGTALADAQFTTGVLYRTPASDWA